MFLLSGVYAGVIARNAWMLGRNELGFYHSHTGTAASIAYWKPLRFDQHWIDLSHWVRKDDPVCYMVSA